MSPVVSVALILAISSLAFSELNGFVVIGSSPLKAFTYSANGKLMDAIKGPNVLGNASSCMIAGPLGPLQAICDEGTGPVMIDFATGRMVKLSPDIDVFTAAFDIKRAELVVAHFNNLSTWILHPPKLVSSFSLSLSTITNVAGLDSKSQTFWFVGNYPLFLQRYSYSNGLELLPFPSKDISTVTPLSSTQVAFVESTVTSFNVNIGDTSTNTSRTLSSLDRSGYDAPSMTMKSAIDYPSSRTHYFLMKSLQLNKLVVVATDLTSGAQKIIPLNGPLVQGIAFAVY